MRTASPVAHPSDAEQARLAQSVNSSQTLSTQAGLVVILILSAFAVAPLFYPGYFQAHSGFTPLWNVADLRANPGNFSWIPHVATNFNPLTDTGLLPYYVAALLPLSPTVAVKLILGIGWLAGGLGMFLWLRSWLGASGAVISALVYIYQPYQIVNVYVRGAWGEVVFWGFLPWAILASTYLVTSPRLRVLPVAGLFWLALGLSQLGLTLWAALFLTVLLLIVHRPQAWLPILSAWGGFAIAVVVYLILPSANQTTASFSDHFLYPFQLVSATWGLGASRPGPNDGLSLSVGLAALGLAILGVYVWQRGQSTLTNRTDRRLSFFSGAAIGLILLQFSVSAFVWGLPIWPGYTLSDTLTYPWQLLGLIGLCLSILAGAAFWLDKELTRLPVFAATSLIIILSVYSRLLPQFIQLDAYPATAPQAELGDAQLALLAHNFTVSTPAYTAGLDGEQANLPLSLYGAPQPGDTLLVNVTWQPLQSFDENLKVFVHLVNPAGDVVAQFDGRPLEGTHPTTQWTPGEIVNDSYPVLLPAEVGSGPYRVYVGLYNEITLERLPVSTDNAGRIILDVQ